MRRLIELFALLILLTTFLGCASSNTNTNAHASDPSPDVYANGQLTTAEKLKRLDATPDGYARTDVLGVFATPEGATVVMLGCPDTEQILPIFVDALQAMTIDLRQRGERFVRPLTHDLLEDVLDKLGGTLAKVHVHALEDNIFHAKLFILTDAGLLQIDARPSDAIALAIGQRIPIFVQQEVLNAGGFTEEDLAKPPPGQLNSPPGPAPQKI